MAQLNSYINSYQKSQVHTASPEQILIMLYNAAINFLNKAKNNITNNEEEAFHHNMECCKNIIAEFMNTLDMETGGEWAQVLFGLYKYLRKLVITSDISKNTDGINEVLKHLIRLRDTWLQAIEISNNEKKESLIDNHNEIDSYTPTEYYDGDDDDDEEEDDEDEDDE